MKIIETQLYQFTKEKRQLCSHVFSFAFHSLEAKWNSLLLLLFKAHNPSLVFRGARNENNVVHKVLKKRHSLSISFIIRRVYGSNVMEKGLC